MNYPYASFSRMLVASVLPPSEFQTLEKKPGIGEVKKFRKNPLLSMLYRLAASADLCSVKPRHTSRADRLSVFCLFLLGSRLLRSELDAVLASLFWPSCEKGRLDLSKIPGDACSGLLGCIEAGL